MFGEDENKPISIIITTLAGQAYNGETCLYDGLFNVIEKMEQNIHIDCNGNYVVSNPVNSEENFADKWAKYPKRNAGICEKVLDKRGGRWYYMQAVR